MRIMSLLLAAIVMIGCGAGNGKHNFPATLTSTITPPTITTLAPTSVPVDSVSFFVTVNGTNFHNDAIVFWNNLPQRTIFVSSTQVLAAIPNTSLQNAGQVPVFVQTLGQTSNTVDFLVSVQ
jgi:hypothetical protein